MSGDMASAKLVKAELEKKYSAEPWFMRISSSREDGVGFYLRVYVRAGVPRPADAFPREMRGVEIRIVETR